MQRKTLEERLEVFNQTTPIEKLELIDTLENGFSYYKSKVNNQFYFSVKEYCIKLGVEYDISKFYDLSYPDVLVAYIDNNNTASKNTSVLLISLQGMEKYIHSKNYTLKNRRQLKVEILKEVSSSEKLISEILELPKIHIEENNKEQIIVNPIIVSTEEIANSENVFCPFEDVETNILPQSNPIDEMTGQELIDAGINKIVQEQLSNMQTGLKKESAQALENFIKYGINEDMQKKIINTAVHIHCNKINNITHENVFSDLYTRFGNVVGRNFVSIKNSFINENRSILDIIVNDLQLGVNLIDFYYNKFDYKDILWAISDCYHCYHDKNLVRLYLNCILGSNNNYK